MRCLGGHVPIPKGLGEDSVKVFMAAKIIAAIQSPSWWVNFLTAVLLPRPVENVFIAGTF
jgi:hypothetical protein